MKVVDDLHNVCLIPGYLSIKRIVISSISRFCITLSHRNNAGSGIRTNSYTKQSNNGHWLVVMEHELTNAVARTSEKA